MHRILIADSLHPLGLEALRESGASVETLDPSDRERLPELVRDYDAIVVRSATQVTREILEAGERLKVVGRAGIGVDNVDVEAATERGILVVNAPTANLISACEHTFALLLALARRVTAANAAMKEEIWDRKSFVGTELYEKTLGVVGFGRIGQQVAARARAFEMEVLAYDPFLDAEVAARHGAELVPLAELVRRADVVTLHVPLTDGTRNLIGAAELATMKETALLVNCARGGVVDEEALLEALEEGRIAGAALDVFASEPPTDWRLVRHERVVATPHIGAQTSEAQERIALQTARMVTEALNGSLAVSAVNLPFRPAGHRGEPYLRLGERLGKLASGLLGGSARSIRVDLWGIEDDLRVPTAVAVLRGALEPYLGEAVNYVNAEQVAASRGLEFVRSTHREAGEVPRQVGVCVEGSGGKVDLAGSFFDDLEPRVTLFSGFRLEFRPSGRLMVLRNRDVPGVVGRLGTILGEAGVNIADIHLGRKSAEEAMAVLRLDQAPDRPTLEKIGALPEVHDVRFVEID